MDSESHDEGTVVTTGGGRMELVASESVARQRKVKVPFELEGSFMKTIPRSIW